ncbi:MAG: Pimeloyl-ACP methyl ester carboxylesterase [Modestobacter sp.]|jgi:3-oxoadipate enol-lactonase|nr:Pimeloyl-ACP methyl ester carboxylesterase [Modestobacter sp.]MCW2508106.1 Pimeloyl-ACP methyl ester carboxylesterase [Modestobacter sp.]MCW2574639.1 Pimeloyl-ACP methyl ester carboxylesterase [Modestobacter sp.]MCW2617442.1 Pimeloyl-ACP methyl ester carboxylesterase [Modestobacter sp.]
MPEVTINGHTTTWWETGSGEPLLFIMGTGMSGRAWAYEVEHFAATHRCITYDMRGVGTADCPDSEYTPALLAEDAVALLDAIGIDSAHVMGFSLGSCTAQEMVLNHPDRVRSAVLLSTWGRTADEHHVRRHYESRRYALQHATLDVFGRFAFWMWSPTLLEEEHERITALEGELRAWTGSKDVSGFIGHFSADLAHDTIDRLPTVDTPVLVVHGDEDRITLPRYNRRVAAAIPGAVYVEIPRAGHLAFLEQPAALNKAVGDFLSGLEG